jgi:nucleotide-binding universal stress UspA family protein
MSPSFPYQRVAVAIDGSDRALDAVGPARAIATLHGAGLVLVTVAASGDAPGAAGALLEAAVAAVGPVDDAITLPGSDPGPVLGRFDDEHPETLLCLTTRGRRPLARAVLGSVAAAVVSHSSQAVALVGPNCRLGADQAIDRVVACLDGSPQAEVVLPWATGWSAATGARLVLVHVIYPRVPPEARVAPMQHEVDEAAYLRTVAHRLRAEGHEVLDLLVQHADPAEAIGDVVRDLPHSIVVAATTDRSPFAEAFTGSTTARVLRSSTAPLLVASRPAG